MNEITIQSLAQELAIAAGEKDGSWREVGIERDIAHKTDDGWLRWSSVVGWPHQLALKIDSFIIQQRMTKK